MWVFAHISFLYLSSKGTSSHQNFYANSSRNSRVQSRRQVQNTVRLQLFHSTSWPSRLTNDSEEIEIAAVELEVIEELGKGGYGVVERMRHRPSGIIMAVKRIKSSINDESQKRMLVELDTCKKSDCCPQVSSFQVYLPFMITDGPFLRCDVPRRRRLDMHGSDGYLFG